MRRVLLLVNPRHIHRPAHLRQLARIRELFAEDGSDLHTVETTPIEAGPSLTPEILAHTQPHTVLACGGDGTLFDALQSLAGTGIHVGILPFGTGNILASNLALPRDPVEAALRLRAATPRAVRLGKVVLAQSFYGAREWYFAFAAGVGMHAALMQAASAKGKGLAGRSAYWATGLRLLLSRPVAPFTAEIQRAGGSVAAERVAEALAVRVDRLNVWRPGGGLLAPSLRLASVPPTSRIGLAKAIALALATRTAAQVAERSPSEPATNSAGARVRYEDILQIACTVPEGGGASRELPLVEADGEVLGHLPATISITEHSISLLGAEALKS